MNARTTLRLLATLGLILLVAAACSDGESAPKAGGRRGKMKVSPPATVQIFAVQPADLEVHRDYGGEFVSDASADLSAEVAGTIDALHARLGDPVAADAPLADIDPITYRLRVQELQAAVALAEAGVGEATTAHQNLQAELKRKEPLLQNDLITAREIEDLRARTDAAARRIESARAGLRQSKARLSQGRDTLRQTTLRAPFAGVVAERYVDRGDHVTAGQPLFRIVDDRAIYLRLRVAEQDAGQVEAGMPVTLRIDTLGARELTASVARVSPAIDPQTRTMRIDVQRPAPGEPLHVAEEDALWSRVKPGMYARARLRLAHRARALAIPSRAVHKDRDGSRYTWTIVDGKAHKTPVVIGARDEDLVEITEGINAGDSVVVRGHTKLREGDTVQIVGDATEEKA